MVASEACRRCGVDVVRLPSFDGAVRLFHARESTNSDVDAAQRWYYSRGRGAVSGTDAIASPSTPFLTLHLCLRTRVGIGEDTANSIGTIRVGDAIAQRSDLQTAEQSPLRLPGFRWTYRWPSHWAHIVVAHLPQALCGAAVLLPEEMSDRERARISTMHVCPQCVQVNTRRERLR